MKNTSRILSLFLLLRRKGSPNPLQSLCNCRTDATGAEALNYVLTNQPTMLRFLSLFTLTLLVSAPLAEAEDKPKGEPPNIIFILADDLGYGDLACYGHPYAKTPHIDSLAKDGTRFTRYYATGVTCQPSRVGFMTSRHPRSFEYRVGDAGFCHRTTITELLNNNGYSTGHFGKWHLGEDPAGPLQQYLKIFLPHLTMALMRSRCSIR